MLLVVVGNGGGEAGGGDCGEVVMMVMEQLVSISNISSLWILNWVERSKFISRQVLPTTLSRNMDTKHGDFEKAWIDDRL